eukprot:66764_1
MSKQQTSWAKWNEYYIGVYRVKSTLELRVSLLSCDLHEAYTTPTYQYRDIIPTGVSINNICSFKNDILTALRNNERFPLQMTWHSTGYPIIHVTKRLNSTTDQITEIASIPFKSIAHRTTKIQYIFTHLQSRMRTANKEKKELELAQKEIRNLKQQIKQMKQCGKKEIEMDFFNSVASIT